MGKFADEQHVHQQQQIEENRVWSSSRFFCQRCSTGLYRIAEEFNFKCLLVLILSLSLFVFVLFSVFPFHAITSGFDAKESIKLSATVQVCFRLQKPVSLLVPHIGRLEYDIYEEIGVPGTKVAVLSIHQSDASNWTEVVFGVLSDPVHVPINQVSLSVLKSSLIEIFLEQSNLTLTESIFGVPSPIQILEFPGGITVIPVQSAFIWIPQILFNFSLLNSISDIVVNFVELKEQLKHGLHLRSYEDLYVLVTNEWGSTKDPPVTIQASVVSAFGILMPQRLKQLAETVSYTAVSKNLGLDHSVFGKIKEISLSSYLEGTLHAPSPSPAPSPELDYYAEPSASPSPAPSPCLDCPVLGSPPPSISGPGCVSTVTPSSSPAPEADPPAPLNFLTYTAPPYLSPLPLDSYGSNLDRDSEFASRLISSSTFSFVTSPSRGPIWLISSAVFIIFNLFYWPH